MLILDWIRYVISMVGFVGAWYLYLVAAANTVRNLYSDDPQQKGDANSHPLFAFRRL